MRTKEIKKIQKKGRGKSQPDFAGGAAEQPMDHRPKNHHRRQPDKDAARPRDVHPGDEDIHEGEEHPGRRENKQNQPVMPSPDGPAPEGLVHPGRAPKITRREDDRRAQQNKQSGIEQASHTVRPVYTCGASRPIAAHSSRAGP